MSNCDDNTILNYEFKWKFAILWDGRLNDPSESSCVYSSIVYWMIRYFL